jgi:hypothetical protein
MESFVDIRQIIGCQHFNSESVFPKKNGTSFKNGLCDYRLIPLSGIRRKVKLLLGF